MNKKKLIEGIEAAVSNTLVDDLDYILTHLPKDTSPNMVKLAEWYSSLEQQNKNKVKDIIKFTTYQSIFGFLCVLDGVRTIEDSEEKGNFELYFVKNYNKQLINTEKGEYLHDIWKERNLP